MKKVYLIKSSSYNLTDLLIKDIIGDNTNVTTVSLLETSIYDCIEDASYFGLFDEPRVIVIKDVKYFGGKFNYEEESEAIKKFINNLDEQTTIIFICDNIVKTKELTKSVVSLGATIIDKTEIEEADIQKILTEFLKNNDIKLDAKSYNLILANSDNNIDIAIKEIEKLSNVNNIITENIVKEYGSTTESDESFAFVDAVVHKRFDDVFKILDCLINNNVEVLKLLGLLASRFVTMYIVKSADMDHISDEELAKLLNYKNKGRLYYIRKDGKIYTIDQIKEIIINLSELDKKIKTGLNPVYGLKELLLSL